MAVIEVGESDIYTVFVKMSTGGKVNLTVDGKCVYVCTNVFMYSNLYPVLATFELQIL